MKVLDEASVASSRQRARAPGTDIYFIFLWPVLWEPLEIPMPKKSAKKSHSQSAKPSVKPSAKHKISKAAFVRSLPTSTPAKEVVAKAKSQGITLTDAYVYNVRATSKAGKGKRSSKRGSSSTKRRSVTVKVGGGRGAEDLLRAVAAELGLARAIAVLETEHARVRKLLGN
jgi:hypothetical protein